MVGRTIARGTAGRIARAALLAGLVATLGACGGGSGFGGGWFGRSPARNANVSPDVAPTAANEARRSTIWDLFNNATDPNTTVEVNKYLWQASLEVLNFLPPETVDPFSGVILTGYGTPPGGGGSYRALVLVNDPALDARSLKVALETRGGAAVSAQTVRAIEDAILTRARQIRVRDSNL